MTPLDGSVAVSDALARLTAAADTGVPCAPVRDVLGSTDIAAAYAVQQQLIAARVAAGAVVVGRKIGATSAAVQQQLGVTQPDFGVLLDDMDVSGLTEVPSDRLLQPRAEAEIAMRLGADLVDGDLDDAQIRAAVSGLAAAIEIVDSRITNWDVHITDTVADNASSGLYVIADNWLTLDEVEPVGVTMQMWIDDELASEGTGAACLGDPLVALGWLARTAREYGQPLLAGQVVLTGSLGPLAPTPPGSVVRAELSTLGTVNATFSKD
ncbi:2-keto-4-pentenoate hydratase [Rhodococcus sp. RD6.2]|jgi:2-keto-4-pentenoate hydratase|uniref:2-keto-4-pentenoate hydratase n=1 Tax=Rhodococcus sp. RD6.2 TaxID=260936 RepID=UPI00063B8252|nr:fumarylacetoacetate hydrolase family protein [Rhodococcus sp. RD6.2]CRK51358.1 2-keto-4-pentenoate hydratase [Rhodococcus sp. RD6.2]